MFLRIFTRNSDVNTGIELTMAHIYVPNYDELSSCFALFTEQASKYMEMVQECQANDSSPEQTKNIQEQAKVAIKTGAQLQAMMTDPSQWMIEAAWSYTDSVALSLVLELGIHRLITPGEKGKTLEQLCDLTEASSALISK